MEVAITKMMDFRKNIIVPNISWGAGLHECDLLVINKKGFATEVEIKVSKADLKKDFTKGHNHESIKIKYLYYAVPESLLGIALELVPAHAGIIVCKAHEQKHVIIGKIATDEGTTTCWKIPNPLILAHIHRSPKPVHEYRAMTEKEIINICRLGCMRIWKLKEQINNHKTK